MARPRAVVRAAGAGIACCGAEVSLQGGDVIRLGGGSLRVERTPLSPPEGYNFNGQLLTPSVRCLGARRRARGLHDASLDHDERLRLHETVLVRRPTTAASSTLS